MVSTKPYLIRALWQWCLDQGQTPYILVHVDEHTQVPAGFVKDGQITLNIGVDATSQLDIGNEFIAFQARFGGVAQQLFVPVERVAAIYSRESNEGMGFEVTEVELHDATDVSVNTTVPAEPRLAPVNVNATISPDDPTPPTGGGSRPRFTVVK